LETNTVHVQRGHFHQFLKTKLLGAVFVGKLLLGNSAKIFNKVNNCIRVQSFALKEDGLDLICVDLLSDDGRVSHQQLLVQRLALARGASLTLEVL
jgi:hypothetical protein